MKLSTDLRIALAYMKGAVSGRVGGVDACAEIDKLDHDLLVAVKCSQMKGRLTYDDDLLWNLK